MQRFGVHRARRLRRDQTDAELKLWLALRGRRLDGAKFRRQVPMGGFIADFVCHEAKLIIELDGGQHHERVAYDARRTAALEALGFRVVRFWNPETLANLDGVLEVIAAALRDDPSPGAR